MSTTLTDLQMAGLLDIVIEQEKDILELKAIVFALAQIARDEIGAQVESKLHAYRNELYGKMATRDASSHIEVLESVSLQLKQSGRPIH